MTLGIAAGLALLVYLFASVSLTADRMVPFRSIGFVLGTGAVFFFAINGTARQALYLAAAVLGLMVVVYAVDDTGKAAHPIVVPFVALYYLGLVVIPNLVPWICEEDVATLVARNAQMETKLTELTAELQALEREESQERSAQNKKEQVRVASRVANLHTYAREIVQASSPAEVRNLLFHNLTKLMGVEECLALVINREAGEARIDRALHPRYETLEKSRVPLTHPLIASVLETRKPLHPAAGTELSEGVRVAHAFPVCGEGGVLAVFLIGKFKGGDPAPEDLDLLDVLVRIAEGALEQIRIAQATA